MTLLKINLNALSVSALRIIMALSSLTLLACNLSFEKIKGVYSPVSASVTSTPSRNSGSSNSSDSPRNSDSPRSHPHAENPRLQLPTDDIREDLLRYPEIEALLKDNPCIDHSNCPTVLVEAGIAEIKENQIMVLEELHIPTSSFSRYRDRISGFYDRDEAGKYKRIRPVAKVSKPLLQIMDIFNQNRPSISRTIPSLGAYLAIRSQLEIISGNTNTLDHAATVFELMVDKNPDTNFVMAQIPELKAQERCRILKNQNKESALKIIAYEFEKAAQSLVEVINLHNIKMINVSYLSTVQSELEHMRINCGEENYAVASAIVQIKNQFFLSLLQNSEVIILQAAPNDDQQLYPCPFHRRWIRVGYVNIPQSSIPEEGWALSDEFLPRNLLPVSSCITVAINGGIKDKSRFDDHFPSYYDENSLFRNYSGLYAYPVDVMATSWATPLALSFMRFKKTKTQNLSPDLEYTTVINKILDPIKNKQFIQND